jgi:asparagine synthase (glutamine-hydrolysing)
MCGFCGFFVKKNEDIQTNSNLNLLQEMSVSIKHRGPDGHGQWHDKEKGIFLDHRRLSILDLSNKATQPMSSNNGRWKIVFNGEIYNYLELKIKISKEKKLKPNFWKSSGDTEVLINLIDLYGIDEALNLIEGMFSFVIWDSLENQIILARDRLGEKPLYFLKDENHLVFSSDIIAIKKFYEEELSIDINSVRELIKYNYIPSPNTIYKKIKKLEAGTYMKINSDLQTLSVKNYWNINNFYKKEYKNIDLEKIPDDIEKLLISILKKEIISDVPLGIYLSGGIDSTLLASLLSHRTESKLKSFTIKNEDSNFDESKIAKTTSKMLNLEHHEFQVNKNDLLDLIDQLSDVYTEPFADSSQLPSLLLNCKAKNYIKVAIGGDGGDELFGGYNRYVYMNKYYPLINKMPISIRDYITKIILSFNAKTVNSFFKNLSIISIGFIDYKNFGYKLQKSALSLNQKSKIDLYDNLLSSSPNINSFFQNKNFDLDRDHINFIKKEDFIESMMLSDIKYYLTDDILCKVDRASMWNGIEVRSPFLHHKLVKYCLEIPTNLKFRKNENKWILRSIIKKYLPDYKSNLKMGFSSPIDNWLRFEVKDSFEFYLDKKYLQKQGIFDFENILSKWKEHIDGKRNWGKFLWSFLIFQKWFKKHH